MVGAADHEDTVVGLEAIHLVQEVAPHIVRDNGVEVFEYEVTRGKLPGLEEDLLDGPFGPGILAIC